ncbi:GDSL esterase/lipase At1g28570 [Linum grandiflorum]
MATAAGANLSLLLLLLAACFHSSNAGGGGGEQPRCFTSLFTFGDSVTDTGNDLLMPHPDDPKLLHCSYSPYGNTFFGRPTGRCSNGRLIVDFMAEKLGLPLLTPYPGVQRSPDFLSGANLAMAAATALDYDVLIQKGIYAKTDISLQVEIDRFRELLATICSTPFECKEYLRTSLILLGEIGGNDYSRGFFDGLAAEKIIEIVPDVIAKIANAIEELVELGAVTILVPGNFPIGCSPMYLEKYSSPNKEHYDPSNGCLVWYNDFTQLHNDLLRKEIIRLREVHPNTNIVYVDYYSSAMRLIKHPKKFGFTGSANSSCCGGRDENGESVVCGTTGSVSCEDPSTYVYWDDHHFTETAYEVITKDMLEGSFTVPRFEVSCFSDSSENGHSMY